MHLYPASAQSLTALPDPSNKEKIKPLCISSPQNGKHRGQLGSKLQPQSLTIIVGSANAAPHSCSISISPNASSSVLILYATSRAASLFSPASSAFCSLSKNPS
ncbi:hypothetical protein H1N96_gp13 [Escherichia phage PGN590]|uniref:Uncharacterized protein n=1 Tax=Escherichia phage PGN590 TaxID=2714735 RepID=A0A6M9E884_9CAUD|nr:hypothetical protein H1N96_gp13 [Escherichia phage PGN590]QKL16936.1 hypothetical protein [Escherichia phage PGN590]